MSPLYQKLCVDLHNAREKVTRNLKAMRVNVEESARILKQVEERMATLNSELDEDDEDVLNVLPLTVEHLNGHGK